jgi:hypothetical protein
MGTPHQGSEGVDLQKVALRAAKVIMSTDTGISKHLKRDSGWLWQQHGQYEPISGDFVTIFAYETVPTLGNMIVCSSLLLVVDDLIRMSRLYRTLRPSCLSFLMQKQLPYLQITLAWSSSPLVKMRYIKSCVSTLFYLAEMLQRESAHAGNSMADPSKVLSQYIDGVR